MKTLLIVAHESYTKPARRLQHYRRASYHVQVKIVSPPFHTFRHIRQLIWSTRPIPDYVCLIGNEREIVPYYAPILNTGSIADRAAADLAFVVTRENVIQAVIGRLTSGESSDLTQSVLHVENQIDKIIAYETQQENRVLGIASVEGAQTGIDGLSDHAFVGRQLSLFAKKRSQGVLCAKESTNEWTGRVISPSPQGILEEFQQGLGYVMYVGHGSETGVQTSGLARKDLASLTHQTTYPFCMFVACSVGSFDEPSVSLAEALVVRERAGAVAACGSTILQSWKPPMHAMRVFNEGLRAHTATSTETMGDLFAKGIGTLLDPSSEFHDVECAYTWTYLGDPCLAPRITPSTAALPNTQAPSDPSPSYVYQHAWLVMFLAVVVYCKTML